MWSKNSIYEAGMFGSLKGYQRRFIDDFMSKPKDWPTPYEAFPIPNGMNDVEYDNLKDQEENPERAKRVEKYNLQFAKKYRDARTPIMIAYEIEPGFWSLNDAANPDSIICQIDHNDKVFRFTAYESDAAQTVQNYALKVFRDKYQEGYDKKRSLVMKKLPKDYTTSSQIVTKDFTNSKYLTKLDVLKFFKA